MIRAVIVDDEEPARVRLRCLLDEHDDVEVAGEAEDGEQALALVERLAPDLVFLDIQMPGLDGLQVAAALVPPRPRIVFCTAYDQYAVEAFEHSAIDYLLKPLATTRLSRALERVRRELDGGARHRDEVAAAGAAQARLLPRAGPRLAHLDYDGMCRPARGVGGDFYDFLAIGSGRLGLALGDVSGKGMFAGLLMASVQARVQTLAPLHPDDPAALLTEVNRLVHASVDPNRYATFFYAAFDDRSRELTWVNAGHVPPLLVRASGGVERLLPGGTPIGLLAGARYRQETTHLEPGDVLAAFTDGITETADRHGEEFGEERLVEVLARGRGQATARDLREEIVRAVDRFRGAAEPHDDLTLLVARA